MYTTHRPQTGVFYRLWISREDFSDDRDCVATLLLNFQRGGKTDDPYKILRSCYQPKQV